MSIVRRTWPRSPWIDVSMPLIQLNTRPNDRTLRQFGFLSLLVFGGLATFIWIQASVFGFELGQAKRPLFGALCVVAAVSLLFAIFYPRGNRPLFVALQVVGYPIGIVVSYVLLTLVFLVGVGASAILVRLAGQHRQFREAGAASDSFWRSPGPKRSRDRYFRQY